MKLTFYGAAGEVTGSCTLLTTDRARVLIDMGLHQGEREAREHNRQMPPIDLGSIDAVVLTHAHVDHCGRLPLLGGQRPGRTPLLDAAGSFSGPIYATPATIDLTEVLLRDSAMLQEMDAAERTRRRMRIGKSPVSPLYTIEDAERVLRQLRPVNYHEPRSIAPGVMLRFTDAGHILGSASAELTVEEGGRRRVIALSADIGPGGAPLLKDPEPIERADVLVLESTYGDRDHRPLPDTIEELASIIDQVCNTPQPVAPPEAAARPGRESGAARAPHTPGGVCGKIFVPAFAVGRTQQLIFHLSRLHHAGRLNGLSVVIDSPMAIEATELYRRHRGLMDEQTAALVAQGQSPLIFPGLRFCRTRQESAALNDAAGPMIIIAASGMCTGGRILHHLKHGLWRPENHVVMVGFQSRGTLGRMLVDKMSRVRVLGQPVAVAAKVHTLGGLSAHAGQSELVRWASRVRPAPGMTILTHGEPAARAALRDRLRRDLGLDPQCPDYGQSYCF